MGEASQEIRYATSVAIDGYGLMIEGASGAGKSSLAIEMIALGARLIADDQTVISKPVIENSTPLLSAPKSLRGLIEIRQIGLVKYSSKESAPLIGIIKLHDITSSRMPDPSYEEIYSTLIPVIRMNFHATLASKLMITARSIAQHGATEWRL